VAATHYDATNLPSTEGEEPHLLYYGPHLYHNLLQQYAPAVAEKLVNAFLNDPAAASIDNLRALGNLDLLFKNAATLFANMSGVRQPPPLPTSLPSVPDKFVFPPRTREQERLKKQRQRKRRREVAGSRPTLALPPQRVLSAPVRHAAAADVSTVRDRQLEIEEQLGIGKISTKMLRRREQHRGDRQRIITNLRAKVEAETARLQELQDTQPLEEEWLTLHAQVAATKSIRKDQRDGGLVSESEISESDGGDALANALPSVPTTRVGNTALEQRLARL
jgi:hypothetical protein